MALAERAELVARLSLDDQFSKKLGAADGAMKSFGKGVGALATNVAAMGAAVAVGIAGAVGAGIASLSELSTMQAQTAAVIASTGGAAGVTATQVRELASALEDVTTVDDKVVQGGENMLLTFTNIGADVFPAATKAMTDMAIAMNNGSTEGLDLKASAIQLGKALNDPIKGVTALRKVGVTLTDEQEKQIKTFMKAGKVYKAQQIILAELEMEFGNAGKAAGQDFGSDLRRLKDVGEDLTMALATGLLPVITEATKWLKTKLTDPSVMARVKELGTTLASAGKSFLAFLDKVDWAAVGNGLGMAAGAAGDLVDAFMKMPDWAKQFLIGGFVANKLTGGALGDIVGELGKGLIKGVLGMNAGVVNIKAGIVNGGGGGGEAGWLSWLKGLLPAAAAVVGSLAVPLVVGAAVPLAGLALVKSGAISQDKARANLEAQNAAGVHFGQASGDTNVAPSSNSEADLARRLALPATGGSAIGSAAAQAMQNAMSEPLWWARMSLAAQLAAHRGTGSAAAVDETWRKGQLEAANKLVVSSLMTNEKLEGLGLLQAALLQNGTAGDKDVAAKIAALETAVRASAPLTPGEQEAMLRRNLQPPIVTVNVTTNVTARSVVDSTEQYYRVGSNTRVVAI